MKDLTRSIITLFLVLSSSALCLAQSDVYADDIIDYYTFSNTSDCPPNIAIDPTGALGAPDFVNAILPEYFVSLGEGGYLAVEFTDNLLTNSGNGNPDLYIHEVGPIIEECRIAVRAANLFTAQVVQNTVGLVQLSAGFYQVGTISDGNYTVNLDAVFSGYAEGELLFDGVFILDEEAPCENQTPGADIDAVEALSSIDCSTSGVCGEVYGCLTASAVNYNSFTTIEIPCEFAEDCFTNLLPNSEMLSAEQQAQLLSWLPSEFTYQAELVHDTQESYFAAIPFHANCDGRSNTLVLAQSIEGNIFGGYNEGEWSSTYEELSGLDNNFLFSFTTNEKYSAKSGEVHITNTALSGPIFGRELTDLYFPNALTSGRAFGEVGQSYHHSEPDILPAEELFNDGVGTQSGNEYQEGRIRLLKYQVWQLKTSGTPAGQLIDSDNDGICDGLENAGCTDAIACNYNPNGSDDFSECKYLDCNGICGGPLITGCTDPAASNFIPQAVCDNGTCLFQTCSGDFNGDGSVNVADLGGFLSAFGSDCE